LGGPVCREISSRPVAVADRRKFSSHARPLPRRQPGLLYCLDEKAVAIVTTRFHRGGKPG